MCTILELPQVTIDASYVFFLARCCVVVLHVNVVDGIPQAVSLCALPPAPVLDNVVRTLLPGMTKRFECITPDGAKAGGTIASAHIDRISCMSKVEAASVLPERSNVAGSW